MKVAIVFLVTLFAAGPVVAQTSSAQTPTVVNGTLDTQRADRTARPRAPGPCLAHDRATVGGLCRRHDIPRRRWRLLVERRPVPPSAESGR